METMQPVLVMMDLDCTIEQYDQIWASIRSADLGDPQEMFLHVGAMDGNKMVVVDIWRSWESEPFFVEHIVPKIRATGATIEWRTYPVRMLMMREAMYAAEPAMS